VDNPAVLERRPLAIKISNSPSVVRPQAGLSLADVVFEHVAEANLTRFTAIYLSQSAPKVGSVRSCRLIDLEIPAMFKSALVFSGASSGLKQKVRESDFFDRVISPDFGLSDVQPPFARIPSPGKAFEHTLFTNTDQLWEYATQKGFNGRQQIEGWVFSEQVPPLGKPVSHIFIAYSPQYATAEYTYDPQRKVYLRLTNGEPHLDELTGEQIAVDNVVVLYAHHVETDILEDSTGPKPYYSIQIQLWGEGTARLFRNGEMFEGKWVRHHREDLVTFYGMTGEPMLFKPGKTWFQLVPLGYEVKID